MANGVTVGGAVVAVGGRDDGVSEAVGGPVT